MKTLFFAGLLFFTASVVGQLPYYGDTLEQQLYTMELEWRIDDIEHARVERLYEQKETEWQQYLDSQHQNIRQHIDNGTPYDKIFEMLLNRTLGHSL